jgi:hypothetical protein
VKGWLILSLVADLGSVLVASQLLRRAVPSRERSDFLRAGSTTSWDVGQLGKLGGPVGAFVMAVLAEPSVVGRIDLVCERLAEVDVETKDIALQMAMLARAVFAMGALFGIVVVAQEIGGASGWMAAWGLAPVGLGATAAVCCHWMGRVASTGAERRRQSWDALSRLLVRPHMPGSCLVGGDPKVGVDAESCPNNRPGETRDPQPRLRASPEVESPD